MSEIDIKKLLVEKKPIIDKVIEKYLPRKMSEEQMRFMLGKPRYKYTIDTMTKAVSEPFWDYMDRGGKRWRPTLFLLLNEALGGNPTEVLDFVVLPELIHNSTIIHDDIEDSSEERRGKPALHLIFGNDIVINLGDILFFIPFLSLIKNKHRFNKDKVIKAYEICIEELVRVGSGQATDISWHRGLCNADNITEEEYLQMCVNKTGCLARMSGKLAALFADRGEEEIELFGKFVETIGVAFQIQDDILNLTGEEFIKGKGGYGEDITEGKRSLLVIHTLQKANERDRKRLIEILNMHTTDQKIRDEAIAIIKKYGSIEYAKEKARKMIKDVWKDADKLLPASEAKKKLKAFADYLVEREI